MVVMRQCTELFGLPRKACRDYLLQAGSDAHRVLTELLLESCTGRNALIETLEEAKDTKLSAGFWQKLAGISYTALPNIGAEEDDDLPYLEKEKAREEWELYKNTNEAAYLRMEKARMDAEARARKAEEEGEKQRLEAEERAREAEKDRDRAIEERTVVKEAELRAEFEKAARAKIDALVAEQEETQKEREKTRLKAEEEKEKGRLEAEERARRAEEEKEKVRQEAEERARKAEKDRDRAIEERAVVKEAELRAEFEKAAQAKIDALIAEQQEAQKEREKTRLEAEEGKEKARLDAEARAREAEEEKEKFRLQAEQRVREVEKDRDKAIEERAVVKEAELRAEIAKENQAKFDALIAEQQEAQKEREKMRLEAEEEKEKARLEVEGRARKAEEEVESLRASLPIASEHNVSRLDIQSSSGKPFERVCKDSLGPLIEALKKQYKDKGARFVLKQTSSTPHQGDLRIELTDGGPSPVLSVVIECKDYAGRVPRHEIEKFESDVRDANDNDGFSVGVLISSRSKFTSYQDGPRKTCYGHLCHLVSCPSTSDLLRREIGFFLRPHIETALRQSTADSHPLYSSGLEDFRGFVSDRSLPALEAMRDHFSKLVDELRSEHTKSTAQGGGTTIGGPPRKRRKVQQSLPGYLRDRG